MSTATARRSLTDRLDDTEEQVSSRISEVATSTYRWLGKHLFHVTLFITLVVHRDHTVLWIAGGAERALGNSLGGMPASLIHFAALSFDGAWDLVAKVVGL